jgi:hypothetical protein
MGPLGRQKHRSVQKWLLIPFPTFFPKYFASFWQRNCGNNDLRVTEDEKVHFKDKDWSFT